MDQLAGMDRQNRRLPLILIWMAVLLIWGQVASSQQLRIAEIKVKGTVHSSEKMIRNSAALRIGSDLSGSDLQEAIKRLFAKGIFKDIAVDVEQMSGGVIVTFIISEYPKLKSITFSGNDKISEKDLKKTIHLAPGGFISDHLVGQAGSKIEASYVEKGYFLAEANPQLVYSPDSAQADLVFNIEEHNKVKVERVVLSGTVGLDSGQVVKKISNRKRGFLRSSDYKKEKFPEDKDKIIEFCRKQGYIDAHIVSDSFVIDTARNKMTIYIDLYEGPLYYFGETSFSGNDLYSDEILSKALKFAPGEIFNQEKYDESLGEVYTAYQEEGYLHIRVMDNRMTRDSTIDIRYEIIEGLPSEIRLVEITGNTKTKEKVIRRELWVRPGQTFRRSTLMRSLREVMQLNYFADVVPDIRDLPSGDIDLVIKIEEKPTGQVSAGAGYSGQDKLVGTFGLGIPNFRGNGQNANINVDFGSRRNSVSLGFTEPWFMGTPTSLGGDLYSLNRLWYSDFTEGRRGGAIRLGRRLRWPDRYFKVFWRYRLEDVRYHDFSDTYMAVNGDSLTYSDGSRVYVPDENSLVNFDEQWLTTSAVSLTIERDSRDLPTFATKGSRISYTGELAGGILGGRWDYYKHTFTVHKFIPLKWNFVLVGKSKFAYISANDNDKIPYSERFSPGGTDPDGMVRGYADASLSPRTSSGGLLRGISEVVYNFELQFPLMKQQMYVIGFADAGASWLGKKDVRPFSHLYKGAGFGFRLVVAGVGVIGFDFGYAYDKSYNEPGGWRTHFQIGQGF